MNIICKLFGHTIKEFSYGTYSGGTIDGIGREHGFYKFECERCGEPVNLYVHFPKKEETHVMRIRNGKRVIRKDPL
jgi:hypothetical protein